MTTTLHTPAATSRLAGFVEKTPLERYVAPATPSLVGLSRAEIAEAARMELEINPVSGADVQALVESAYKSAPAVIARAEAIASAKADK